MSSSPDCTAMSWDPCENPHTQSVLNDATQDIVSKEAKLDPPAPPCNVDMFPFKHASPLRAELRYAPYYPPEPDALDPTQETPMEDIPVEEDPTSKTPMNADSETEYEYPEDTLDDYETFAQENTTSDSSSNPKAGSDEAEEDGNDGSGNISLFVGNETSSDELHLDDPDCESDPDDELLFYNDDIFPATAEGQHQRALLLESNIQLQRQRLRRVNAKKRDLKLSISRLEQEKLAAEQSMAMVNLTRPVGDASEGHEELRMKIKGRGARGGSRHRNKNSESCSRPIATKPPGRKSKDIDWRRLALENATHKAEKKLSFVF